MAEERCIPINSDFDIVAARVEARNLAREMGFGLIDQARIATAVSELARNVVLYARSGQIRLKRLAQANRVGLAIVCEDQGPGIEDVERIMQEGAVMARESGVGLAGTRRLMDEFEIESWVGVGTTVTVCKWLP